MISMTNNERRLYIFIFLEGNVSNKNFRSGQVSYKLEIGNLSNYCGCLPKTFPSLTEHRSRFQ